ncbi:MAG: bacillithiol biosynthesis cysteine-adding enzyme BshC [Acidobacteriaceae bacterium]
MMNVECYPISVMPHTTRLFHDFLSPEESGPQSRMRRFYPVAPFSDSWIPSHAVTLPEAHRNRLADLLEAQNRRWEAGPAALENIARLRAGAGVVVTGQQVGLFGGPLLTLLKAATAIRKAQEASAAGKPHVPLFWLATEDHDFAEVNHLVLPCSQGQRYALETLHLETHATGARPVGGLVLGEAIQPVLEKVKELLGYAPICDLLEQAYTPGATMGNAFAQFIARVFADQGLIVIDASERGFHELGADTLRYAIEHSDELHDALLARNAELEAAGYHVQVMVPDGGSLLFLLDDATGARVALKKTAGEATWKAGGRAYSTEDLLQILASEPERISPNALLRPIFQDTLLPTSMYVGGPAEVAYFAQSQVIFERILGHTTPILPRLTATLIETSIAKVMAQHELQLADILTTADALAQKLGARAMPIEGKRKLSAAGNTLDRELTALTEWMHSLDENLGRSADVSASKMLYQMNRLRRIAANYELQREASLRKHADALTLHLYPHHTPQERVLGGIWFLARYGDGLASLLVEHASQECPGHRAILL